MCAPAGLFALVAGVILAVWSWVGTPIAMPPAALGAGDKLYCVSYAPFRNEQSPLISTTRIERAQIEEDLTQLSWMTGCVRTYSIEMGLDQVPEIAQRHGLKVLQGIWLSDNVEKNRGEIEIAIALTNRFPDVIRALIVGNEVLLRGDMSITDLANTIVKIKSQVSVPVTYAEVWEYWLRFRQLYEVVDFITVHILPYWEDIPIPAGQAATHLDDIRQNIAAVFPGKEILIGETGWPSAGRMRQGALPSRANQARVLHDVLALAKRKNYNVNVMEAYDQPWKRSHEGTVGGYWGLFDSYQRVARFTWGEPVSDYPYWRWQAAGGIAFEALIFAAGFVGRREAKLLVNDWLAIAVAAMAAGVTIGWAAVNLPIESLGVGGWARSLALMILAIVTPLACAVALAKGTASADLAHVLKRREWASNPLALALGALMIVLTVLSIQIASGLVYDPRYRDFPVAPLSAATLPFLVLSLSTPRPKGARGKVEMAAAAVLTFCAIYISFNETLANWQAVWFCMLLVALALTLSRVRHAAV